MAPEPDPWRRPGAPPPSRARLFVWLGFLAALGLTAWWLLHAFPEQHLSGYDEARAAYGFALIALISSGVVFSRQFTWRESLRNIAIWAGVVAVLGLGYLYRDVFADIGARLQAEILPAEPRATGPHTVVLAESEGGSYYTVGEVNGVRVKFLVDTGASDIVLSPEDATRLGVDVASLNFTGETETANGIGRGAPYSVTSLAIGPIRLENVSVQINQAPMSESLLGMTFLRCMKSFEFKERKLYLHW